MTSRLVLASSDSHGRHKIKRGAVGFALLILGVLALSACTSPNHKTATRETESGHGEESRQARPVQEARPQRGSRTGSSGPVVSDYLENERSSMAREDQQRSAESLQQSKSEEDAPRPIRNEPIMPVRRRP